MTNVLEDPTPLQPNYLPENLYDREEERERLQRLNAKNTAPQNFFLHGSRGTGKTHVTHLALEENDRKCYVPCTQHDTQYKALKQIYNSLTQEKINSGHQEIQLVECSIE